MTQREKVNNLAEWGAYWDPPTTNFRNVKRNKINYPGAVGETRVPSVMRNPPGVDLCV